MSSPDGLVKTAPDPTRLDGFEAHFTTTIEPPVRLPQGLGKASPRSDAFTYVAAGLLAVAGALWLFGAGPYVYGLIVVAGAGFVLAAIQLRMGGHGMSLKDARGHIVSSMAAFLGLHHEPAPSVDELHDFLAGAGRIAPNSITQIMDRIGGHIDEVGFESIQLIGAVAPNRSDSEVWLGLPLTHLSSTYTADGLLARLDLPADTGTTLTLSSDRRLAHRESDEQPLLTLERPRGAHDGFTDDFRIVAEASDVQAALPSPAVQSLLSELTSDLGPLTLRIERDRVFLSIWAVGDVYEISSLGGALRDQCKRIAIVLGAPARLGRALAQDDA